MTRAKFPFVLFGLKNLSGFLKYQVVCYACGIAFFLQSLQASHYTLKERRPVFIAVFSADGDDKWVDVFSIHSGQPLELLPFSCLRPSLSKVVQAIVHLVQFFERHFLFSCSKINSSTEQTEANLPSAIFQSARFLCNGCRMTFFVVRVADWTNDISSQ